MHREEVTTIIPKPESITWEEISQVLQNAHKKNLEAGVFMPFPFMKPEEIREKVESKNGVMFVALLNGQLVGTGVVMFIDMDLWCGKGKYAYSCFDAVLPEHAGKGIYKAIALKQEEYAKSNNINRIFFDTHEKNHRMIKVSKKSGYELVDYKIRKDHNSVLMVKWLEKQPYSHFQCMKNYLKIKLDKKYYLWKKNIKKKIHI